MFYLHGVGYGVLNNVSSIRFTYSNTGTQTGCLTMYLACTVLHGAGVFNNVFSMYSVTYVVLGCC